MTKNKHNIKHCSTGICALICVLTLTLSVIAQYASACSEVRTGVLRLHVIANSDSESDQQVKLSVRDAVLECGSEIFNGSVTSADAVEKITPELSEIEKTACAVLSENGKDYGARAFVTEEYFDTRTYGDITLPAGKYKALKIVLGEGDGKNWWCVMFPPLCLPAATVSDDSAYDIFSGLGAEVVSPQPEYEIRFGIVELFEKIMKLFTD